MNTILVVDDDLAALELTQSILQSPSYEVIAASSGEEADAILCQRNINVVLLDLMMPGMDGFEVVKALRDDPETAEIPIIMITARDDLEARRKISLARSSAELPVYSGAAHLSTRSCRWLESQPR